MKSETEAGLSRTQAGTRTRAETVTRYTSTRAGVVGSSVFWGRRALRAVRRASGAAGTWLSETVTSAGWLLLAVLAAGVVGGLALGWVEAWVVAAVALLLLLFCVPFLFGGHDYRVHLVLDRDRVVAGTDVDAHLEIRNQSHRPALPGIVDVPVGEGLVEAHVPLLLPGAEHRENLVIGAHRRGVITVGPMTIARGDPIGILRREVAWPQVEQVFVHPVTVPIPSTSAGNIKDLEGSPTRDIVPADLSFHAIREYAPGDSQRHVHWKSTAKTGVLMVRQYEETRRARIAVVLDLRTEEFADDDEFEMAVSAAASLGVQGVRDGRDVLVSMSADIPELARTTTLAISTIPTLTPRTLLDGMSQVEGSERALHLETVTSLTVQAHPELSTAFVVTGSRPTLTRLRTAALAFPVDVVTVAVRVEPGAEPTLRSTGDLTVMTIGALHDLTHMIARGALS
ncbi:MAG: hypothetical protein BGO97_08485 [Micrococcales bacterium 70-64]|nr:DUF58 domain-containing protein [Leifsonia sp.]ODU64065.1 MAG: hypothetical protein ABT06_08490 [Leifsonia sp. SCN 70-46]OJX85756.1 MAG: hypothetical protein BGO97_08485 [Micrococcales bacterium 70-64]